MAAVAVGLAGCGAGQQRIETFSAKAPLSAASKGLCGAGQLAISISPPSGAAGSSYYTVSLTNRSAQACALEGYSTISFRRSAAGTDVGPSAQRQEAPTAPVTLQPSGTAYETVRLVNSDDFPSSTCQISAVSGLSIDPPGQSSPAWIPLQTQTCATGAQSLFVWPIAATVGSA